MSDGEPDQSLEFAEVRRILEAAFVTHDVDEALDAVGAEERSVEEVRAYLADSERARRYFDRLARADRALDAEAEGDDSPDRAAPTSGFERAFGNALFESALDEIAGPASDDAASTETTDGGSETGGDVVSLFGGQTTALAAAAAAVLALGAALYWFGGSSPAEEDEFRARSAADPPEDAPKRSPRVELFCAQRGGGEVDFEAAAETPGPELECPVDAELKLAYENPSSRFEYAAFFGIDADGNRYWYGPSPAAEGPVSIETRTEGVVPVGETIRLEVNHSPGTVRVFALFADRPVDYERLSSWLDDARTAALFEGAAWEVEEAEVQTNRATLKIEEETKR